MSHVRVAILLVILSASALAEQPSIQGSALPEMALAGSSVAANATLPISPLTEEKRPFALALGIALVIGAFGRSFMTRQRA